MCKQKYMLKSLLLFVLSFVIAFTFIAFPTTKALACSEETHSNISYNKEIYDQYSEVCDKLYSCMKNMEEKIYIGEFNLTCDVTQKLVKTVIRKHPELYFVDATRYMEGTDGTYSYSVYPIYLYDANTVKKMQKTFDAKVNKYLSKIDESMTDFQKVAILHDELVINCHYYDEGAKYITAYNAIVEDKANCQGYSEAYAYLLSLAGIKTEIVESSAMFHMWNKVCIDGEYYNVDLTWDDPMPNKEGHVGHKFFLLSDEAICSGEDEIAEHYGFDYAYFKSDSKKYDKCKYRYINTKFCFVDDSCYYIDNTYNVKNEEFLVKYDYVNDASQVVESFGYRWRSSPSSYWRGGFMSLDENAGLLYFNSDKEIYTYDVDTHEIKRYSNENLFDGNCYGMRIIDNKVYALIGENPNVEGELELVGDCVEVQKTNLVMGDLTSDGAMSIIDVTYVQKYSAGLISLSKEQLSVADYNNDGYISVMDATLMQKTIAGL